MNAASLQAGKRSAPIFEDVLFDMLDDEQRANYHANTSGRSKHRRNQQITLGKADALPIIATLQPPEDLTNTFATCAAVCTRLQDTADPEVIYGKASSNVVKVRDVLHLSLPL